MAHKMVMQGEVVFHSTVRYTGDGEAIISWANGHTSQVPYNSGNPLKTGDQVEVWGDR